jgi:glutathione S-transferase
MIASKPRDEVRPMFTLHGLRNTRTLRVAWTLEELGLEYRYVAVQLFRGEHLGPAFGALNPGRKVPVLVGEDGAPMTESAAIIEWLAETYRRPALLPLPGEAERAAHLRWLAFILTELESPLWTLAQHRFALPQERRVAAAQDTAVWCFGRAARLLSQHLEGRETLLDCGFGTVDILACHCLAWARSARVPLDSTALDAYLDRHWRRPALVRALAREDAACGKPADAP